ncbi:MAG: outer membrane beta-barrel protein [Parvibaculaceae bacterium]
MVRQRFIYCGIAAAFILSGEVRAQEDLGLRTSLDASEPVQAGGAEAGNARPAMLAAEPTTLEIDPIVEPPPPPRRKLSAEEDPYEALGIQAGGLTLFPVMRAGVIVSDNPGLAESGRKGDIGARLRPSLRIASDWVRHELTIEGAGDLVYYDEQPENDSQEVDADARLRLDVLRSTTLTLAADFDLSEDNGVDSDVPDTAIGNRTDYSFGGSAALTHRVGRLWTTLSAGADWQYYGDVKLSGGGEEDNADREYVQPQAVLRVGYDASPAWRPFVEAAYAPRFHFEDLDRNGFDRDSNGYRVALGVAFDPSPIWSGELALSYLWRDYADSRLETLDTFGVTGRLTWRPTELTTLDLILGTGLVETAEAGVSGARDWAARLAVSHDLREYLTIHGGAGLSYEDFQGTDETELKLRGNAGVLWRMNRWLAWTLDYDFVSNDNSEPGSDYYENRVTAGIEVRR